jgi:hypothetical protein
MIKMPNKNNTALVTALSEVIDSKINQKEYDTALNLLHVVLVDFPNANDFNAKIVNQFKKLVKVDTVSAAQLFVESTKNLSEKRFISLSKEFVKAAKAQPELGLRNMVIEKARALGKSVQYEMADKEVVDTNMQFSRLWLTANAISPQDGFRTSFAFLDGFDNPVMYRNTLAANANYTMRVSLKEIYNAQDAYYDHFEVVAFDKMDKNDGKVVASNYLHYKHGYPSELPVFKPF